MRRSLLQNSIFALILIAFNMAANSSIQGKIADSQTGHHLIGANIMLEGTILGAASDENGNFLIYNVPLGSYTLISMYIGYKTFKQTIKIEEGQVYTVDIKLISSAIKLQETKVTAEKRKGKITTAPASMEIVTSRDIRGKNTTNMGAYLKGLKGVDFTSSGMNNYSISIRGFNSSFNTRVLTLSDGRVASIPALRVINYSTIPQSMDDVDRIEVILGPATALYGANAHSGVVNIISKPPAQFEGLTMSITGSGDERQLRKINGRFAKKLSNSVSIKVSGLYLHAYDWPFVAEEEYKAHLYPWSLTPGRVSDGKDNNPWNAAGDYAGLKWQWNESGDSVRIGNGEQMDTGDPDGDGFMGEDWFNGYDDDGDGLIDEDYFTADGIDNGGIPCTSDSNEDGCYCCYGDLGVDEDIDNVADFAYDGIDNDHNGIIDDEAGDNYIEATIKAWGANIENNILIPFGRKDSLIGGEVNPFYVPNLTDVNNGLDLMGNHRYNEDEVRLEFDIFSYDYGEDGIPGDGFIDIAGDTEFQLGECLSFLGTFPPECDNGLDGDPNTDDPGQGDGIWQPGDGWDDDGDGIVELGEDGYKWIEVFPDIYSNCPCGFLEGTSNCLPYYDGCDYGADVWPPINDILDAHETHNDYGQDGYPNTGDPGEDDGRIIFLDAEEMDGVFDTGDGIYGFEGEPIIDLNGNGILDPGEEYIDTNGDGRYNAPDLIDDYQVVLDRNGDGLNDYPDFEIDNRKVEFRLDFDPNQDFNLTFQSGYSWTKTQQVTGTGRYIADGFEYKFYQLRSRYKNWFSQAYMNESFSGNTRGYILGNRIIDKSKNYAYQIQNNFYTPSLNTKFVWGMDYFRTEPYTYGTILNDGPNGYDNDGDNVIIGYNNLDEDNDGEPDDPYCPDGKKSGFRNGKYWKCGEGIDEPDEFIDPLSNEYGLYYQSTTELFGTSRYELITAARLDYHDLLEEGLQFAPKIGFIYKPNSTSSMRFTYGKAYNTPNSISLFTDLYIGSQNVFDIFLRGNYKGTDYCRVGSPCLGENFPTSVAIPGFYSENGANYYVMGPSSNVSYFEGYPDRVEGAPYFFKFFGNDLLVGDNIPLDTSINIIYVPSINSDGVLYTPKESINIPNVDPIRTEKIQTWEFGYKGFIGRKTHVSLDYYLSYYEDFFSPPTIITPLVVKRIFDEDGNDITNVDDLEIQGIMTINDVATYPPYATGFNGLDDDGDWAAWASTEYFGWADDDKNGDCPNGAGANNPCWADPGEWGFVGINYNGQDTIFHPWEVLYNENGYPDYQFNEVGQFIKNLHGQYITVGVDEWHETSGLNEHEIVEGATDQTGQQIPGVGVTAAPYHLVLSPMNYGEVWMQGFDFGITHFISEKLIIDGNVSWYGTTEFYNELTRRNDPINAPEWKWNANIKWNSSLGDIIFNLRHVERFEWSDGIWAGFIGPYDIVDLHYKYMLTENLALSVSALNVLDDRHKELIGGAEMGRQIVMRFTSTF